MESTASASSDGAKAGERFAVIGSPSITYCTSYSEPRGCKTPFASYNHPGRSLTRSERPRPGCVATGSRPRSEEHTSELQSLTNLVCRLLLEKKKKNTYKYTHT